jgi:hypothetical protein
MSGGLIVPNDLVGWWCPSLDATGALLVDRSGRNNHGALTNMDPATDWVISGGKGALDFDGSDDRVGSIGSLGSYSFIQNTMRFSFSWWMRLANTTTRYAPFASTANSVEKGFFVVFENGVGLGTRAIRFTSFRGVLGSPVSEFRSADDAITDTEWHHVSISANGSGNTASIYVDGKALSLTVATNLSALATGDATRLFTLASSPSTGGFILPFGGQLDDIRVFNRALPPSEVRQLYQIGRGNMPLRRRRRYTEQAAGFKAYWANRQHLIGSGVY